MGSEILGNPGPRKCSDSECPIQISYSKGSLALMLPEIIQDREPGNFISHCFGISGFLLLNIYIGKLNKRKKSGEKKSLERQHNI